MSAFKCDYLTELRDDVQSLSRLAFAEDTGAGDVTAEVLDLISREASAFVLTREPIAMCGVAWYDVVLKIYRDASNLQLTVQPLVDDGTDVAAGTKLFQLTGNMAAIVGFERTFLNFLHRGIGIASKTRAFVTAVRDAMDDGSRAPDILDTRKTQPGYRTFDKYAVLCGGGSNHRMHLGDMVLIKENHVARFGSVAKTLDHVRRHLNRKVPVQIEVRDLDELRAALDAECPLIMLDNFTPAMVREACQWDKGPSRLEVSGGITLENIGDYAVPNLDRISTGSITHSVAAPDLTLLIEEE